MDRTVEPAKFRQALGRVIARAEQEERQLTVRDLEEMVDEIKNGHLASQEGNDRGQSEEEPLWNT